MTTLNQPTELGQAFMGLGQANLTINRDLDGARSRISDLHDLGISLVTITKQLLDDGGDRLCQTFPAPDEVP